MSHSDASTFDAGPGPAASKEARAGGQSLRAQLAWGGSGFLLGVIVWHFVGFWSFISTIVFRGPEPGAASVSATAPATRVASLSTKRAQTVSGGAPTQVAAPAPASDCSELVLDRTTGTTTLAVCSASSQPTRLVLSSERGDRRDTHKSPPGDWSVVVDADQADAAVGQTLAETTIDARLAPRFGQRSVQLD